MFGLFMVLGWVATTVLITRVWIRWRPGCSMVPGLLLGLVAGLLWPVTLWIALGMWWHQRSLSFSRLSPAARQGGIVLACVVGSLMTLVVIGAAAPAQPADPRATVDGSRPASPTSTTAASLTTSPVLAAPAAADPPLVVASPAGPPAASVPVSTAPAPLARPSTARAAAQPTPAPAAGSPVAPAPAPPAPATPGACIASPRDPTPGDRGDETITVHTTAGATVNLKVHYKTTTHPFSGVADSTGTAIITFSVGRPTPGYPVRVDVSTSSGQVCTTQFTPQ